MKRCAVLRSYSFDIMMCNCFLSFQQTCGKNVMILHYNQKKTRLARPPWSKTLIAVLRVPLPQGYGFPVSQLFDMLLEMREQYGEILLKRWNITFRYSVMFRQQIGESIPMYTCVHVYTFNEGTMHVTLTFPLSVIRVHRVLGPLHTLARVRLWETSSSWFWSFTTSQREEVF